MKVVQTAHSPLDTYRTVTVQLLCWHSGVCADLPAAFSPCHTAAASGSHLEFHIWTHAASSGRLLWMVGISSNCICCMTAAPSSAAVELLEHQCTS